MSDADKYFVLECETQSRGHVEFYINGIPLARRGAELGPYYSEQVNEFLIKGTNQLSMLINPPSAAAAHAGGGNRGRDQQVSDTDFAPEMAMSSMRLASYPVGAVVGGPDAIELLRTEWRVPKQTDGRPMPEFFPKYVANAVGMGGIGQHPWAWQLGDRLTLSDEERQEIVQFIGKIHKALDAGDPEPFIDASLTRLRELGDAYASFDPVERISLIRKVTAMKSSQPGWGMEPLEPENLDLHTCANNRIVECRARDWKSILREKPDAEGGVAYYQMFLSKIAGSWHIVR